LIIQNPFGGPINMVIKNRKEIDIPWDPHTYSGGPINMGMRGPIII